MKIRAGNALLIRKTCSIGNTFLLLAAWLCLPGIAHAQGECLQWILRTNVGSCGDRAGHSMAYDIHRNVTVFFGGDIPGGNYFNETWEYDGTLWRRITIDGPVPPGRAMAAMAYDEVARYMVLVGGEAPGGGLLKDTWIYRSTEPGRGTWTYAGDIPVANDIPAERAGASMTFDESSQKLVMIGGATFDNGDEYTHATVMCWNREGGWGAHPGGGMLPFMGFNPYFARNGLARHFAAYDTDQDWLFFHGGWLGCYTEGVCDPNEDPNENPFYAGLKTNQIRLVIQHQVAEQGRQQGAMVYDSNRRRFVSFGGFNAGSPVPSLDTPLEIIYTGNPTLGPYAKVITSRPTLGNPPHGRTRLGMVYDRARRVTVIYGGAYGQLNYADTWELVPIFPERLSTPALTHEACEDTAAVMSANFRDPPQGYDPNTFQWLKNGQLVPGATSHQLSFPALAANDAGQYQYILTTPCGHSLTQSPPTELVVFLKPSITAFDVTRQDRCPGDSVSWSVTATGEPPLLYQWRKTGFRWLARPTPRSRSLTSSTRILAITMSKWQIVARRLRVPRRTCRSASRFKRTHNPFLPMFAMSARCPLAPWVSDCCVTNGGWMVYRSLASGARMCSA